jgi:hypothetical protein
LFQRNEELETVVGEQEEELVAQREQLINRDCQILELLSLVEDFEQRLNKIQLSEEDAKNVNCYVQAVRETVLVDVARPSARSLRSSTQLNKITPKSKSNLAPLQPGQYREGMDQKELELNTNFVSHAKNCILHIVSQQSASLLPEVNLATTVGHSLPAMMDFDLNAMTAEIVELAPVILEIMEHCMAPRRPDKRHPQTSEDTTGSSSSSSTSSTSSTSNAAQPRYTTETRRLACVTNLLFLVKGKSERVDGIQSIISLILAGEQASLMTFRILNKLNICLSFPQTQTLMKDLIKELDAKRLEVCRLNKDELSITQDNVDITVAVAQARHNNKSHLVHWTQATVQVNQHKCPIDAFEAHEVNQSQSTRKVSHRQDNAMIM